MYQYREQFCGKGWADTIYINTLPHNFWPKMGGGGDGRIIHRICRVSFILGGGAFTPLWL